MSCRIHTNESKMRKLSKKHLPKQCLLYLLIGGGFWLSSCQNDAMFMPEEATPTFSGATHFDSAFMAGMTEEMILGYQTVDKMGIIQ